MPIYEYQCRECRHRFEVLQKIGEDNKDLKCPKCNTDKPKRVLSAFSGGLNKCSSKGFT